MSHEALICDCATDTSVHPRKMLRHIKNCFYAVSFFFFAIMTAVYLFGTENTLAYLETLPDDEDISCLNIRKWPNCSINFKDWCKVQKPPREDEMLPDDIVQNIKQFVLFIGHARSGSSIIGAVLDAHPNMMIAYEYYVLHRLVTDPKLQAPTKVELLSFLAKRSSYSAWHFKSKQTKGYGLHVPGGFKGTYEKELIVIGDKAAGPTTDLMVADELGFVELLQKLQNIVEIPLKFINIIRNPFDNIATMLVYEIGGAELRINLTHSDGKEKANFEMDQLDCVIQKYFSHAFAIKQMNLTYNLDILQVHLPKLIRNPKQELQRICSFLEIECSEEYIATCENVLFEDNHMSRNFINWTDSQIEHVQEMSNLFEWLQEYTFYSD